MVELSVTELHNMPDTCSIAPLFSKLRSPQSHFLVLGRGSARIEASYVG